MYIYLDIFTLGTGYGSTFILTANVGVVVPSTASAAQLVNGIILEVNDNATILFITPTSNDCPPIEYELPSPPATTTTSTTTTIRPDCQCYYLYHDYNQPVNIIYRDCNGRVAGFTLPSFTSMQMCGSNFYSDFDITIVQGGPCIPSGNLFECDGCSTNCNTYYVQNSSNQIQTFNYIDCNGQIATASVPASYENSYGEINVCVCGDLAFDQTTGLGANVIFEGECILCKCYKVYNPTDDPELEIGFTNCDNNIVYNTNLEPNEIRYVCSLSNGFTADPRLTVTNTNNYCQILQPGGKNKSIISRAGIPNTPTIACEAPTNYCYNVTVTGTVTIQYVNGSGILTYVTDTDTTLYLCAWEGSVVKSSGSGTITVYNTLNNCDVNQDCEPCFCYTVYNNTADSIFISFSECKEGNLEIQIGNGDFYTYCGHSLNNPVPDGVVVLRGNLCNDTSECSQVTTTTSTTSTTTSTTTTLPLNCFRFANSTSATIVVTVYDQTGFPGFVSVPPFNNTTYGCGSSWNPITGITGANLGSCALVDQCQDLIAARCIGGAGIGIETDYYKIERVWNNSPYIYRLYSMILNGVQFASSQILTINAPGDLVVATSIVDGLPYIVNINDWLNNIPGVAYTGWVFHDDMHAIDKPTIGSTYFIQIARIGGGGGNETYFYTSQYGFAITDFDIVHGYYTCNPINIIN
jgi:hypothetical protein